MDDIDILRSARILVKQYGADEAPKIAAKRAHALQQQGDAEGFSVWVQIIMATISFAEKPLQIDDKGVWRAAQRLIEFYPDWETEAARRINSRIECGDPEGESLWKRIRGAARELTQQKPREGETVN